MKCHFNEAMIPSLYNVLNVEYSCLKSPIYVDVKMTEFRMSCNTNCILTCTNGKNRTLFCFLIPFIALEYCSFSRVEVERVKLFWNGLCTEKKVNSRAEKLSSLKVYHSSDHIECCSRRGYVIRLNTNEPPAGIFPT